MSTINEHRLLQLRTSIIGQNAALQRAAGRIVEAPGQEAGFDTTLMNALNAVNNQDAKAQQLTESYEKGETSDIVSVMVERQKASLGFEATLQVRNKLLSAYRDIMNMPV